MKTVAIDGVVVFGEGKRHDTDDSTGMLYDGERVGAGTGTLCDVAVNPLDDTRLTSEGMGNAVSVLAVAPRGAMLDLSAVSYMDQLVGGGDAVGVVDIRQSPEHNIYALACAKDCTPEDITVCMLDPPRHENTRARLRDIVRGTPWKGLHPHAFRHLIATRLDRAGLSAREIADYHVDRKSFTCGEAPPAGFEPAA